MIQFDFINTNFLEAKKYLAEKKRIPEFLTALHQNKYNFLDIDGACDQLSDIDFCRDFDAVVICGFGGSSLGLRAAVKFLYKNFRENFYILDSIDPFVIHQTESQININTTLFVFVSNSGETNETKELMYYFWNTSSGNPKNFIAITADKPNSILQFARDNEILHIPIRQTVSGRYSIFSIAGLFPMKLAGLPIDQVLKTMKQLQREIDVDHVITKKAFELAYYLFSLHQDSCHHLTIMQYGERLGGVIDWYCQLLAESSGKEKKGIYPIRTTGTKDEHSLLQIWLDGPKSHAFLCFHDKVDQFSQNFAKIFSEHAIRTCSVLGNNMGKGAITLIKKDSASYFVELIIVLELSVYFMTQLIEVNPFNQPAVDNLKQMQNSDKK